jgi:hypothetical protein
MLQARMLEALSKAVSTTPSHELSTSQTAESQLTAWSALFSSGIETSPFNIQNTARLSPSRQRHI